MKILVALTFLVTQISQADASCVVLDSQGGKVNRSHDPISFVLNTTSGCPTDVFQFRERIKQAGLKLETTLVANRGFHNPSQGSFSIFEMVTGPKLGAGEFFFGHFTAVDKSEQLIADQHPDKDSLMIEAFAWDAAKGYFNFYELRGAGTKGQWFYRGDSADIFADNSKLHRQSDPANPSFGSRLRCSACHSAGGPVMKEIHAPHNDWWEPVRKLDFGGRHPDPTLAQILATLVPADKLAASVSVGLRKLESSSKFQSMKSSLSLQEQLRPLFCPLEVNFQSDGRPNSSGHAIHIPLEFFVDSRLVSPKIKAAASQALMIARDDYEQALAKLGSQFPETNLPDADHAWLTPVKAKSDKFAVNALIAQGIIDQEFAADILAVDFVNPVVSKARCSLLRLLPNGPSSDWKATFASRLQNSKLSLAGEAFQNLTDPTRTLLFHQKQAESYLRHVREELKTPENILKLVRLLNRRRNEIRASEISKNPRGQILEPGFRVIFPKMSN